MVVIYLFTIYATLISFAVGWSFDSQQRCFRNIIPTSPEPKNSSPISTRRHFFSVGAEKFGAFCAIATAATTFQITKPANAFENRISDKWNDRPKQRGSKPRDLGVSMRKSDSGAEDNYIGLKKCGTSPNCFCSTDSMELDPEHSIPAWKWPSDMKREDAFQQLEKTIQAYKPGQNDIDGGGFKIITSESPKYMYVQFESFKNGFIDDVEFASLDEKKNEIQVRSSSRLGFLDFGVNAKRLNYISSALRKEGWEAVGVDYKTHPEYVEQNRLY